MAVFQNIFWTNYSSYSVDPWGTCPMINSDLATSDIWSMIRHFKFIIFYLCQNISHCNLRIRYTWLLFMRVLINNWYKMNNGFVCELAYQKNVYFKKTYLF